MGIKIDIVPEIVYYVAASIDGYIATSDGGVEWLAPFEGKGEDYGYSKFYSSVDAVLLGRKTYEQSLTFGEWPYPGKPCWVFSRGALKSAEAEVTCTNQNPRQIVAELENRKLRRAWLVGGASLASVFQSQRLISEYVISVIPIVLGGGIPLFEAGGSRQSLKHVETKSYPSGIVQLTYVDAQL